MQWISMSQRGQVEGALANQFGEEFRTLPLTLRLALVRDLFDLTHGDGISLYSLAAEILAKRIHPATLESYARAVHASLMRVSDRGQRQLARQLTCTLARPGNPARTLAPTWED